MIASCDDLGDGALDEQRGGAGSNSPLRGAKGTRAVGRVDDLVPPTTSEPDHPYFVAEYDLAHRG